MSEHFSRFPFTRRQFEEWFRSKPTSRKLYRGLRRSAFRAGLAECCPLAQFLLDRIRKTPVIIAVYDDEVFVYSDGGTRIWKKWDAPKWVKDFNAKLYSFTGWSKEDGYPPEDLTFGDLLEFCAERGGES